MGYTIGFIGLGKMGLPMALCLANAGHTVYVSSSNPESAKQMEKAGGISLPSIKDLAEKSEIIISIVPADNEVMDIYTRPNGILEHVKDGAVCIDMTSAKGSTMLQLEAYAKEKGKNISFIDAPVSGGVAAAKAGTLTIMVGCEKALYNAYLPVLECMGKKILYTGKLGSGSNIKMLNQMLNAANTAVASEVICLAKALEVDLQSLCNVVNESSGGSWIFKNNVPKYILSGDHTPGFRLDLMKKDVGLVMDSAQDLNAFMPVSNLVYQLYKATSNQGNGQMNYTYIAKWLEENQK